MTAEIAQLDAAAARSLTDRIKVAVEGVWHLIEQAYTTRAWAALGYESWDDYCTREFGTSRLRLPREERQEVVASLRESGLSTRAIASGVGVAESTVRNDLSGAQDRAPETITGRDGKTYPPKAKVTETTKTEYTVDTETGEITEPTPMPRRDSPPTPAPNPIGEAVKAARSGPAYIAGNELERIFTAVRGIEQAGGPAAVARDLGDSDLDRKYAESLLTMLDRALPVLTDLRARLGRRNLRSVQ